MRWTNTLCVCLQDGTEQEAESKFTTVPLGGMSVQCIVVTQRIRHTLKTLLSFFSGSLAYAVFLFPGLVPVFSLCFYPVCSCFLLAHKQTCIQTFYLLIVFDLIPLSVTHLMFYSCKTYSFKRFLCNVPTNLQSLAFLLSCIAS